MLTIQPQYLSLNELLKNRLFRIPEYQRAYSWGSMQRKDLFEDIRKVYKKGSDAAHFLAAVVCLRTDKQLIGTDEYYMLDVVDGQQRLTTLIILLKATAMQLSGQVEAEQKLKAQIEELLVKQDSDELLLLQTNHDTSHYFSRYIRSGQSESPDAAKTIADRQILNAIEECKAFVAGWKNDKGGLTNFATILKNRLFFLLHEIDREETVYTVFEVLNSRGMEVSWFDRLKSILMGIAYELDGANNERLIKDLHIIWRDIYSVIGLRKGLSSEALRFAATLHTNEMPNRPLGEKDAVELLRSGLDSPKSVRSSASWLLEVTTACNKLAGNSRINAVTRISQARLLAISILLRNDLSEENRSKLLSCWERVSFRIYGMLGNDARYRVGDFVRLAWRVTNSKLSPDDIESELKAIGADFKIEDAIKALEGTNCYEGWETELRYFMFRYEEHLAESQNLNFKNQQWEKIWNVSASKSIEHIQPQSKASKGLKHRLGNLVLLPPGLNSKLKDLDPKDKVDAYRKSGLLISSDVADAIEAHGWSNKSAKEREEKLLQWAENEWGD